MIAVFFAAVGLGQMLLFHGNRPRIASVVVGACFWWCLILVALIIQEIGRGFSIPVLEILVGLVCWMLAGPLLGYLAGLLIAGVFLLIEKAARRRGRIGHTNKPTSEPSTP